MPVLALKDSGAAVVALQQSLNARAQSRFHPQLLEDGSLGQATMAAFDAIGFALGFTAKTLAAPTISVNAQKILTDPAARNQEQIERARRRQPRLAERTIAFDGTPIFWGLAKPLVRARASGWQGKLSSADRRKGVAERFGKKSQVTLHECFTRSQAIGRCPPGCSGDCNPANAPGCSSHELRSDGAAFPGPRGRLLEWWELGFDAQDSAGLLLELTELGYKARRPYSSASEFHHLNFTANPGPVIAPTAKAAKAVRAAPAKKKAAVTKTDRPPGRLITRTGPDVSVHQGDVDWKAVKGAGHDFAIVNATEGADFVDKQFGKARWAAIKDAGLTRGAYHYARPQPGRDPRSEVRHFLATVAAAGGLKKGDLRPVLDLEESKGLSGGQVLEWARGFVRAVHDELGGRPIIYTGHFWRDQMGNPADDLGCPLWLAAYVKDPAPYVPRAWRAEGPSIWQHTETGRSPGISGNCDLNRFHGPAGRYAALRMQ